MRNQNSQRMRLEFKLARLDPTLSTPDCGKCDMLVKLSRGRKIESQNNSVVTDIIYLRSLGKQQRNKKICFVQNVE